MHLELDLQKTLHDQEVPAQGCFAAQQLPRVQLLLQKQMDQIQLLQVQQPGPLAHQQKSPEFQLDQLQRLAGQAG